VSARPRARKCGAMVPSTHCALTMRSRDSPLSFDMCSRGCTTQPRLVAVLFDDVHLVRCGVAIRRQTVLRLPVHEVVARTSRARTLPTLRCQFGRHTSGILVKCDSRTSNSLVVTPHQRLMRLQRSGSITSAPFRLAELSPRRSSSMVWRSRRDVCACARCVPQIAGSPSTSVRREVAHRRSSSRAGQTQRAPGQHRDRSRTGQSTPRHRSSG